MNSDGKLPPSLTNARYILLRQRLSLGILTHLFRITLW